VCSPVVVIISTISFSVSQLNHMSLYYQRNAQTCCSNMNHLKKAMTQDLLYGLTLYNATMYTCNSKRPQHPGDQKVVFATFSFLHFPTNLDDYLLPEIDTRTLQSISHLDASQRLQYFVNSIHIPELRRNFNPREICNGIQPDYRPCFVFSSYGYSLALCCNSGFFRDSSLCLRRSSNDTSPSGGLVYVAQIMYLFDNQTSLLHLDRAITIERHYHVWGHSWSL
jgi:hypothetical protein